MRWARSSGFARHGGAAEQPSRCRDHGYPQGTWRTRFRRAVGISLSAADGIAVSGGNGAPGRRDMRADLCTALVARSERPEMVLLTVDLGFMALEPLRGSVGGRFSTCGFTE